MALKAPPDTVQHIVSLALDATFYRTVYGADPEAFRDPLGHYAARGWRERLDPAPWFSVARYLDANPDVATLRIDPFFHYLQHGRWEGRDVYPSEHAARYFAPQLRAGAASAWSLQALLEAPEPPECEGAAFSEEDRALAAAEFDPDFYLTANPDVVGEGRDALAHFLEHGWREGRDPNRWFAVRDYLDLHPDIAEADINPFLHYLRAGRAEGRKLRHDLGFRYDILARLVPIEERVARAAQASGKVRPRSAARLGKALATSRSGLAALHVTFSHDDFTANVGGVQLCLQREAAAMARLGRDHLHLFPATPWPVLRVGEAAPLGVVWNGELVGAFRPATVIKALGAALGRQPAPRSSFAIHSLLGHAVDEVLEIVAVIGRREGFFWLHDFASLCAGYHLMRNDVQDCGAPPPESAACGICVYGPWRARHLAEHERLFAALDLTVVSPSQPALDFWRAAWPRRPHREQVHPHARLVGPGRPRERGDGPFRLAFAGMPAAHKGWPVFRDLALRFAGDPRYDFIYLGGLEAPDLPSGFRPVTVSAEAPLAMRDAMAAAGADAALVWPLCRETFSFTAHEAAAAGAAVITNPDSGNVAAFVEASGHGRVLADEAALVSAFESGEILELARAVPEPRLLDLAFSAMTADLLEADPRP